MILNLSCGFFFTYFENKALKYMNYTIRHTFTVQTFIVPQNYTGGKKTDAMQAKWYITFTDT